MGASAIVLVSGKLLEIFIYKMEFIPMYGHGIPDYVYSFIRGFVIHSQEQVISYLRLATGQKSSNTIAVC